MKLSQMTCCEQMRKNTASDVPRLFPRIVWTGSSWAVPGCCSECLVLIDMKFCPWCAAPLPEWKNAMKPDWVVSAILDDASVPPKPSRDHEKVLAPAGTRWHRFLARLKLTRNQQVRGRKND